tara:strand:- start:424 stop:951 length:528 start_codon:yes stop_codon:yes gene_type:complete
MKKQLTLIFLSFSMFAFSQTIIENFVMDWERSKKHSLSILEAMPKDKFDYKVSEESKSFAEEFLHIVQANYGMMSTVLEKENIINSQTSLNEELFKDTSKENVITQTTKSYDFVIKNIKDFDENKLNDEVTFFGKYKLTKARGILKVYEHQAHHKSKAIVNQRAAGVKPPNYMLF